MNRNKYWKHIAVYLLIITGMMTAVFLASEHLTAGHTITVFMTGLFLMSLSYSMMRISLMTFRRLEDAGVNRFTVAVIMMTGLISMVLSLTRMPFDVKVIPLSISALMMLMIMLLCMKPTKKEHS